MTARLRSTFGNNNMHRIVDTISSLVLLPLVMFLGFVGLMTILVDPALASLNVVLVVSIAVTSPSRKRRSNLHSKTRRRGQSSFGRVYSTADIVHLLFVALAICYVVRLIESSDTDSSYYSQLYWWLIGVPFAYVAPLIHTRIAKNLAEQGASSDR